MKRYIEIVYDNSRSMTERIGVKAKYEIAQELFEKEILPTVGFKGDEVVLRLLRKQCNSEKSNTESLTTIFGNNRKAMLNRIKIIEHDQTTPLFYTIYDSIQSCKKQQASECLIFILTDGDDTCNLKITDLIEQETIDKYVKYYKVLLVQLAVTSKISSNNLSSLTSYLGGQTLRLGWNEPISEMKRKMRRALNASGFSSKLPLDHCFDEKVGAEKSWEELEIIGLDFHQASLLFFKDVLSWEPNLSKKVSDLELAELNFLYGLYFKTGLPDSTILSMLAQLKRPYYYSHDCIYWDFFSARWKYFIPQNRIEQIPNHLATIDDQLNLFHGTDYQSNDFSTYYEHEIYEVHMNNTINVSFSLRSVDLGERITTLKPGDLVKFNWVNENKY